jgi:D-arabinose 1-dehydrogenase-like Zn-dependent alcohol dehydrogenase
MATMKAAVFLAKEQIKIREVPRPEPRAGEALIKVTLTTICGTDVHILKGEYPVKPGAVTIRSEHEVESMVGPYPLSFQAVFVGWLADSAAVQP